MVSLAGKVLAYATEHLQTVELATPGVQSSTNNAYFALASNLLVCLVQSLLLALFRSGLPYLQELDGQEILASIISPQTHSLDITQPVLPEEQVFELYLWMVELISHLLVSSLLVKL